MNKMIVISLTALLCGCGQSGALYLPAVNKPSPAVTTSDMSPTSTTTSSVTHQQLAGDAE